MKYYSIRHVVTLEETNIVGNVYFAHHLRWQGHCRERFLRDRVPGMLSDQAPQVILETVHCSCTYLAEIHTFDLIEVRMYLQGTTQNQIHMRFDYFCITDAQEVLVAKGEQTVSCMTRQAGNTVPIPIPEGLKSALAEYA